MRRFFYVASPFQEYARARRAIAALTEAGHRVTFDWTAMVDAFGSDGAASDGDKRKNAVLDLDGVIDADVLLLLTPTIKGLGCGMWVELGAAITVARLCARREVDRIGGPPRVVIAGPERERTIFCQLADPESRYESDDAAIACAIAILNSER